MLLERFCPVRLAPSNKATEKGIKMPCRNTDRGELSPGRCPLRPRELLVLHELCNTEAGKPAPAWNEPRARVSEQSQGQAGLLCPCPPGKGAGDGPVSPVPAVSCCSSLHPCCNPGQAREGSVGLLLVAQVQGWRPGPPGPGGGRAGPHTQLGPNLPPPGPAGALLGADSLA